MTEKKEDSISIIEMDKKKYKELIKNTILLKRENENLKIENDEIQKMALDKYNEIKTSVSKSTMSDIFNNIKNQIEENKNDDPTITTSSIFKKKQTTVLSNNSDKNKTNIKSSIKSIQLINTTEIKNNQNNINQPSKKITIQCKSNESNESVGVTDITDSSKSSDYESEESVEYTAESDIYRTATTDDGINKTYRKLNDEMERISKTRDCLSNRDIAKRIEFLLNGLRILDNLKIKNKK
jgi:hypothetical protein